MRQVARHVHKREVGRADELDFGGVKEAVVVFAHETRIIDGFLRELADGGFSADDADVVRFVMMRLLGQGDVLADEHTNADA